MPLDPATQGLLALLESMGGKELHEGTPEEARAAFRLLTVDMRQPDSVIPVRSSDDIKLPGPDGPIPVRRYRPDAEGPLPTVVFFHGGGFVIGDLDTHDNQCRAVCRDVEAVVLSVQYRLAPEAPWPAAVDDCVAATRWAADNLDELGGDADRIAVAGDSAGGNLAAVVAQACRDDGGPKLAAQMLVYPVVDFEEGAEELYPSMVENAEGYFLTTADMMWFAGHYGSGGANDLRAARLSPLHGSLEGLPPAVVVTAEFDPLRDQGEAYVRALEQAGVRVVHHRFDGLIHGFFDLAALSPASRAAIETTCADLRALLN